MRLPMHRRGSRGRLVLTGTCTCGAKNAWASRADGVWRWPHGSSPLQTGDPPPTWFGQPALCRGGVDLVLTSTQLGPGVPGCRGGGTKGGEGGSEESNNAGHKVDCLVGPPPTILAPSQSRRYSIVEFCLEFWLAKKSTSSAFYWPAFGGG